MYGNKVLQIAYLWSVTVAAGTLGVLVYTYLRHRIKVLRIWAISWMFFILMQLSFYGGNKEGVAVCYSFFSGALLYGVLLYFREHTDVRNSLKLEIIGIVPPLFTIYLLVLKHLGISEELLSNEAPYVVLSGVFFLFSGLVFLAMKREWRRNAFYLGILLMVFGLFVITYPLRISSETPLVWISIGSVLSVVIAFFMITLVTSKEFLFFEKQVGVKVTLEPGGHLITSDEYQALKEELKEFPVLAFVRSLNIPESWKAYFLSTEERKNSIYPTNLAYMAQLASEYFKEAERKGLRGVVVIDCPEYLLMYNGFESIAKFLASLKDFAMSYGGVLLIVVDESAWNAHQLAILKRVLE
ncbi:DUF835 domain-containing protein [Thermococcus sp. MV5]|uniref:DUF835 domain-containing protein n=1 Tax=Thermococcus sp. MV5 TaxID=1638272 RepID=UPI00143ACF13|nr:DUF835 domain-containing protein [Thermococcus sp. MV5]NJE26864.1 DUF835 domain-containing protein [Thermococcus sp. MV5]